MSKELAAKNPFSGPIVDALAAWVHMEALIKLVEAETLRGNHDEAEKHRQDAHAYLDAHMDAKQSACILGLVNLNGIASTNSKRPPK